MRQTREILIGGCAITPPMATVAVIALAYGLHAFVPRQANAATLRTMTARSVEGRLIKAFVIGNGSKSVLLIGGIHGNEPSGARLVSRFERWAARHWRSSSACTLVVVPDTNPDGHAHDTRKNAHHVDLNRNFPPNNWGMRPRRKGDTPGPRPASEPETRFILKLIKRFHPRLIVSVHSPYHQINIDGPAMPIARDMRRFNHDRITRAIGYPTPGSLGSYAGKDKHIPVVTLELASQGAHAIWKANRPALSAAVDDVCGHGLRAAR